MKVSLGPVLYYWSREKIVEFYEAALTSDADIIYLGEAVCSKRHELRLSEWLELASYLSNHHKNAQKQIVLSSLALIEARSELSSLQTLIDNCNVIVEANDMGAVTLLNERKLPFITGSSVNIYNHNTLHVLAQQGLQRWVAPVELSQHHIRSIVERYRQIPNAPEIETELYVCGKIPLAYSARCFTARALNLSKDDCQYSCLNYPNGLALTSQDQQQLFMLNGIQTLSGKNINLLDQILLMKVLGADVVRISPEENCLDQVTQAKLIADDQVVPSQAIIGKDSVNGYWFGRAGMER